MSAINYHISQTDWIKYINIYICAKVIPIKKNSRTWHGSNPTSKAFSEMGINGGGSQMQMGGT